MFEKTESTTEKKIIEGETLYGTRLRLVRM